jgi:flagellar basal body-associated protein FliL
MAAKKIIIIAAAALVVLGAAGGGAAYFMGVFSHPAGKAAPKPPPPPKPILFAALTDVVVSVPPDTGEPPSTFVQFAIQFSTTDPAAIEKFTELQPIVKSQIISLLMNETGKTLQDPAIRATLTKGCLDISNNVLTHTGEYKPGKPFDAAYITNLVVQN